MSLFEVKVYKLRIEPHPNADKIEICRIGDYCTIVGKDQFIDGSIGVYIPEGAVVPDWIIEKLDLVGKLAGPKHNRVKAVKLRGIVSQGLIYPITKSDENSYDDFICGWVNSQEETMLVTIGDDVTDFLGIIKYEPQIPTNFAGDVCSIFGYTIKYDIENLKKFPNMLQEENEYVVISEKTHGTWCCYGYHVNVEEKVHQIITSKGLSAQGLAFKLNENNKGNLYIRTLDTTIIDNGNLIERAIEYYQGNPFYILGEIIGQGVQDLTYGLKKPEFRAFDIYVGTPGSGDYLNFDEFKLDCANLQIKTVPILYEGLYNKNKLLELTNGKETVSGTGNNIREGVVVKPVIEKHNDLIGRVILKSVSDDYILRKGNVTEFS